MERITLSTTRDLAWSVTLCAVLATLLAEVLSIPLLPSVLFGLGASMLVVHNARFFAPGLDRSVFVIASLVQGLLLTYHLAVSPLPLSGNDWRGFERHALAVLNSESVVSSLMTGVENLFPKLVATLYWFFGAHPPLVNMTVYLMFQLSVLFLALLASEMDVPYGDRRLVLLTYMLLPINLIYSVSYLREVPIQLLAVASVYAFAVYLRRRTMLALGLALVASSGAALMHSGMIILLAAEVFVAVVYGSRVKGDSPPPSPMRWVVASAAVVLLAVSANGSQLTDKFGGSISVDETLVAASYEAGNTSYLEVGPQTPLELVASAPLRTFQFLASPLPWQVYDFNTALALVLASVPQWLLLGGLYLYLRRTVPSTSEQRALRLLILLTLLGVFLVFALGTANYGTAIRHRTKVLPLLLLVAVPALRDVARRLGMNRTRTKAATLRSGRAT